MFLNFVLSWRLNDPCCELMCAYHFEVHYGINKHVAYKSGRVINKINMVHWSSIQHMEVPHIT